MSDLKKYEGVIPAFYACYDDQGEVSPERTRALVQYFIDKGVQGLYVNGSSGECIYQSVEDRKLILESLQWHLLLSFQHDEPVPYCLWYCYKLRER